MSLVSGFDYEGWVNSARDFCQQLSSQFEDCDSDGLFYPALTHSQVSELSQNLNLNLPTALIRFLEEGCSGLDITYVWELDDEDAVQLRELFGRKSEIWGGSPFCVASEFVTWKRETTELSTNSWVAESEDAQVWAFSLPIAAMPNGDYLALDLRGESEDPPVVYLSHEELSTKLSGSFTDFLTNWAGLCYLGPELWLLSPFVTQHGLVGIDDKAQIVKQVLVGPSV